MSNRVENLIKGLLIVCLNFGPFSLLSQGALAGVHTVYAQEILPQPHQPNSEAAASQTSLTRQLFIPIVSRPAPYVKLTESQRVNAPYFVGEVRSAETAILWFGKVTSSDNYTDVRVGYNNEELFVRMSTFDQRLWYTTNPVPEAMPEWDATSLYINTHGPQGELLDAQAYKYVGQLNWWEPRDNYQAAYRGSGGSWARTSFDFITQTGYRGNAPQDAIDDRGWLITYRIPFSGLGLSGPPAPGTVWGIGFVVHDRDDASGQQRGQEKWPDRFSETSPSTWGELSFGVPVFSPQAGMQPAGSLTIRHKLNGDTVSDGMVGGNSTCGKGLDFWSEWGEATYMGRSQVNVQNQHDVADFPCFSKFYITFPLDTLPEGKTILSGRVTLYQFGNAGGGDYGEPHDSLIQVATAKDGWLADNLNWNNAPQARENIGAVWVSPIQGTVDWPGVPWTWDVSRAVADAYARQEPLRLVFYSADADYNSGKYFTASPTGDWNETGRPTLEVTWGNP